MSVYQRIVCARHGIGHDVGADRGIAGKDPVFFGPAESDVDHLFAREVHAGGGGHGGRIHARSRAPERHPFGLFAAGLQPLRLLFQQTWGHRNFDQFDAPFFVDPAHRGQGFAATGACDARAADLIGAHRRDAAFLLGHEVQMNSDPVALLAGCIEHARPDGAVCGVGAVIAVLCQNELGLGHQVYYGTGSGGCPACQRPPSSGRSARSAVADSIRRSGWPCFLSRIRTTSVLPRLRRQSC